MAKQIPIDEIYNTAAYNRLDAFCDDDQGGDSCFTMADRFDRQQVVNLLLPIIRREERQKFQQKCRNCKFKLQCEQQ